MKKLIYTFFIILFLPINILAYSKNIIPGGESIGIKINTDGLVVVGFYKVDDKYIAKDNIRIGDRILKVNNRRVYSINDFTRYIDNDLDNSVIIEIELIRNNKIINTNLELVNENNVYKTGLYIKDSVLGLGTLTYIDPYNKVFGALGHEITFNETKNRVEVKDGNIISSRITSIVKSRKGSIGSKNASIIYKEKLGSVIKNINEGVYGFYNSDISNRKTIEIASFDEIEKGEAYILTVLSNQEVKKYKINILDKYYNKKDTNKAFGFEIIDKELISKAGGIIQGMSGSPIIQNNKLIGAVTNVVIDNVTLGYGISIITMLNEGDKIQR